MPRHSFYMPILMKNTAGMFFMLEMNSLALCLHRACTLINRHIVWEMYRFLRRGRED